MRANFVQSSDVSHRLDPFDIAQDRLPPSRGRERRAPSRTFLFYVIFVVKFSDSKSSAPFKFQVQMVQAVNRCAPFKRFDEWTV